MVPVFRPSIYDGTKTGFNLMVVGIEKSLEGILIQINHYLYTESSSIGWGAHLVHYTASGTWERFMKELTSMCYVTGLQCCNNV
jgi:hypothetical protein